MLKEKKSITFTKFTDKKSMYIVISFRALLNIQMLLKIGSACFFTKFFNRQFLYLSR